MAMNAAQPMQFGQPIDPNYARHIYQRAAAGDPQAIATLNTISNMPRGHPSGINAEQAFIAAQDAQMPALASNAPEPVLAEAGSNTAVNPQFFGYHQNGALSEASAPSNNNGGGGGALSMAALAAGVDPAQAAMDGPLMGHNASRLIQVNTFAHLSPCLRHPTGQQARPIRHVAGLNRKATSMTF